MLRGGVERTGGVESLQLTRRSRRSLDLMLARGVHTPLLKQRLTVES
jgi:hypothetical protein